MRRLIARRSTRSATLRETRAGGGADAAAAATLAELAGADAVRLGVGEDGRPVREADLRETSPRGAALELRIAPTPSLAKVALEVRPARVVLASEGRAGPGPLDLRLAGPALASHPAQRSGRERGSDADSAR